MTSSPQFRLRWKGSVTGPFTMARIQEMLRAGEISLLHNIEVEGHWTTLRDHLRPGGAMRTHLADVTTLSRPGSDPQGETGIGLADPTSADIRGRNTVGEALERNVRAGYLWCGATFLLPPVFSIPVMLWTRLAPETPVLSQFVLLTFMTAIGAFLPLHFVQRIGLLLEPEGLREIRQAQWRLSLALAFLSLLTWTAVFWLLTHAHP